MTRRDHGALQNSDLNPFLYADVGTELNGSTLTMLSVLARLDLDPWVEAARWAKLPKAAVVESLITLIDGISLLPQTASGTRAAAGRLVMLLAASQSRPDVPAALLPMKTTRQALGASLGATAWPKWLPMAVLAFALILGIALNLVHAPGSSTVPTELAQTKVQAPAAESR